MTIFNLFFLRVQYNLCWKIKNLQRIIFQDIKLNNLDAFRLDIAAKNWDTVLLQHATDDAENKFPEEVLKLYRHHFPYESI